MRLGRATTAALALGALVASGWGGARHAGAEPPFDPRRIGHLIVLFQENWSFDGLYSQFPGADGIAFGTRLVQLDGSGRPIETMPFPLDEATPTHPATPFTSTRWTNPMPVAFYDLLTFDGGANPFRLASHTADVNHRFMAHRLQVTRGPSTAYLGFSPIDSSRPPGAENVNSLCLSGVDASGLPEGLLAKEFVLCDRCFQSAFGGSFLNHQFLVAAGPPVYRGARAHAPSRISTPLPQGGAAPTTPYLQWDNALLATPVDAGSDDYFAVNTMQPPYAPTGSTDPDKRLAPQTHATIADRLDAGHVSWAWFSEGWNLNAGAVGTAALKEEFQTHHQPFNYFERFDPVAHADYRKAHLLDLDDFVKGIEGGSLPSVSFVKLSGEHNEHPGYANLIDGQKRLEALVRSIQAQPAIWDDVAIVITYDEFGGRFDHVAPPHGDFFGPATRIPMIVVSPFARRGAVDHTTYETVSILSTIESRWALTPVRDRDAKAAPLWGAFQGR